eukprot:jgi/Psemu1/39729/gm1.39729_g
MVVPRGTPYIRLNKPAKDSSSKAQAYHTPYQKEYNIHDQFPLLSTRLDLDSHNKRATDSSSKAQAYDTPYQKEYNRFPPPDPPNARITTEAQRAYQIHQEGPTRLQGKYRTRTSLPILPTRGLLLRPNAPTRYTKKARRAYKESIATPGTLPERDGPFGEAPARHDIYQAIYTLFNEADGDQLLPLLLDIFNAQAIGGLGIFQEDAAGVDRLRVIHGLRRYPGTITQPSANRGQAFGYIDDVEGQEVELVRGDAALLSRAAASRVYLLAHHEANVSQHPEQNYIPAIPEGTAHTEMLQAHKQAFQVLQPHIHQQGLGDICKPLLDTLRAVGTQPTTLLGAIWLLEPGPAFRAEANLHAYMKKHPSQRLRTSN